MPPYDEYNSLWEGNSPNAAHAYRRMEEAGQAPDNAWLERLFSRRREAAGPPAPSPIPSDEGRFAPSPFEPPPAPAPRPQPKPVSKLSSANRIRQIIQQPWQGEGDTDTFQPIRRTAPTWTGEGDTQPPPSNLDPLAAAVNGIPNAAEPPPPRIPIDMRDEPSQPTIASMLGRLPQAARDAVLGALGRTGQSGNSPYGNNTFGGYKTPGTRYGGAEFGSSAARPNPGVSGVPSRPTPDAGGGLLSANDEGRGMMVQEDQSMREMQRLLKMVQMMQRLGVTGGTGDVPADEPAANAQQNQTFWDLLSRSGNPLRRAGDMAANAGSPLTALRDMIAGASGKKFGGYKTPGTRYGGKEFGASANPWIVDEPPPYFPPPLEPLPPPRYVSALSEPPPIPRSTPTPYARPRTANMLPYADGGEVPGFMRGGYPELRTAPIRHQFDSGGQNYVGAGSSSGRADNVDARLSPKEYVVDAETMSMLGDGNPDHGAKKMDQFRQNVRKHKGRALAKGKFSPNAKNPAEYLVGNPMGDGMRRLGKGK